MIFKYLIILYKKIIIYIRYLLLSRNYKNFIYSKFKYFENKNVVLIGPAEEINDELINKAKTADIIALINKNYKSSLLDFLSSLPNEKVLFHCLDETEIGGCGSLEIVKLNEKSIDKIFYPLHEVHLIENVFNFFEKKLENINLFWIDRSSYKKLKNSIGGFVPNTGFAALYSIYLSNCSNLYVHGLTFHRTSYVDGFGIDEINQKASIKIIELAGNHNPDMDWLYFLELKNSRRVELSPLLTRLVNEPYKQLFYINDK